MDCAYLRKTHSPLLHVKSLPEKNSKTCTNQLHDHLRDKSITAEFPPSCASVVAAHVCCPLRHLKLHVSFQTLAATSFKSICICWKCL